MRDAWMGLVLLCVAGLPSMSGQNPLGAMGTQQQSTGAMQTISAAIFSPVTGQPYQAQKITNSVQKLSDGTMITHETKGLIARDTEGRMREDLYLVKSGQVGGHEMDSALQSATVGDPVTHTILIWTDEKSKIAMKMQMPSLGGMKPHSPVMGGVIGAAPHPAAVALGRPASAGVTKPTALAASDDKDDVHVEELGQQSIEGVLVTGKRTTTTIATGKIGNDRPIVVVHEEWTSPELQILVKTVDRDPRTGEETMQLTGLARKDPSASLFHAPEDYTVMDMAEMMKGLGDLGKTKTP